MKKKNWILTLSMLAALGSLLAGCAPSGEQTADNPNPSTEPDTAGMSAEDAAKATDTSTAASGDNLSTSEKK